MYNDNRPRFPNDDRYPEDCRGNCDRPSRSYDSGPDPFVIDIEEATAVLGGLLAKFGETAWVVIKIMFARPFG